MTATPCFDDIERLRQIAVVTFEYLRFRDLVHFIYLDGLVHVAEWEWNAFDDEWVRPACWHNNALYVQKYVQAEAPPTCFECVAKR